MNNIVTLKYGLEVTQIIKDGTIRKFGCGFQFAFHSNYGSILHHFGDKARYWSKIIFSYPLAFDAPVRRVPVGIVPWRLVRKNWNGLATRRWKIEDTFIRFHMIHERDGRTHRHTDRQTDRQTLRQTPHDDRPRLCILRGKNISKLSNGTIFNDRNTHSMLRHKIDAEARICE